MDKTPLATIEILLLEAVRKTDLTSVKSGISFTLEMASINIISIPLSLNKIEEEIFGKDKPTEHILNFIIKLDTMLQLNGYYNLNNIDYSINTKYRFVSESSEQLFVKKYIRLIYTLRMFAGIIVKELDKFLLKEDNNEA